MADVTPFPFANVDDLKARWPDFPTGAEAHAMVLLEDASQFILDTVPTAANATEATRRRVVCAVVRRAMPVQDAGMESIQQTAGPFSQLVKPVNPNGDFYLTKQEQTALGAGAVRAFGVPVGGAPCSSHVPWCNLNFGARYCSCGADIAGEPIYERDGL
ncbi:hypothetical protein LJ753_16825 [Arthrobacter sp. zg-Y20]|uniref:hypothetical protein n=1 Tax=unclassified Arthrobacter TaxID=235627 RepID=UPI001D143EAE|nr:MULTISPECIES: hypothetical protein [unclassified Arthrobacter]MCC3277530.1 hypothetical protein [Arthrobacter sp. zg-Y20]MDK1317688.1 hypothetical protein [Arthrobacter sp. zg.Y20]WIB07053.1 hypothetical protein QNO06_04815 [Arthrobacter sp. zg-Y20]